MKHHVLKYPLLLVCITLFFVGSNSCLAQFPVQLRGSESQTGDQTGFAVAVQGIYAFVGAHRYYGVGSSSGAVTVFAFNGSAWEQLQVLTPTDASAGCQFGRAIAVSRSILVISSPGPLCSPSRGGAVHVFQKRSGFWYEIQKLTASDSANSDWFGVSVDVRDDIIIVGAENDDDSGGNSGSAYIFAWNGSTWEESAKLVASDGAHTNHFGVDVKLSGEYAFVGSIGHDHRGDRSGAVYVFERTSNEWSEIDELLPSRVDYGARFGFALSVSENRLVVGAPGAESGRGLVYVFEVQDVGWTEQAILEYPLEPGADFGIAVASKDQKIFVGAPWQENEQGQYGALHIFEADRGDWVHVKLLESFGQQRCTGLGQSISTDQVSVVTGAPAGGCGPNLTGSAYVFDVAYYSVGTESSIILNDFTPSLSQNYPNPFNSHTTLRYSIVKSGAVKLNVYNLLGKRIAVLVDAFKPAGEYTDIFDAANLTPGIYFYSLTAGDFSETRRMVVVK